MHLSGAPVCLCSGVRTVNDLSAARALRGPYLWSGGDGSKQDKHGLPYGSRRAEDVPSSELCRVTSAGRLPVLRPNK